MIIDLTSLDTFDPDLLLMLLKDDESLELAFNGEAIYDLISRVILNSPTVVRNDLGEEILKEVIKPVWYNPVRKRLSIFYLLSFQDDYMTSKKGCGLVEKDSLKYSRQANVIETLDDIDVTKIFDFHMHVR